MRIWEAAPALSAIPDWFPVLAETVATKKVNRRRTTSTVTSKELLELKQRFSGQSAEDDCSRWARWFFADRARRTISPGLSLSVSEYVQQRIEEGTYESLSDACRMAPANAVALARLARHMLLEATNVARANALIHRAAALADDPEVAEIRASILRR